MQSVGSVSVFVKAPIVVPGYNYHNIASVCTANAQLVNLQRNQSFILYALQQSDRRLEEAA
jgi:hypothetical protein